VNERTNPKRCIPLDGWILVLLVGAPVGFLILILACPGYEGGDHTKTHVAHLTCSSLSQAAEAYRSHPNNPKHEFPRALTDLLKPPWGGSSYLKNGRADLLDPWGKEYEIEISQFEDGREYVFIKTTRPDGVLISNFGIGKKALPPR
jgi:hypothetical protein